MQKIGSIQSPVLRDLFRREEARLAQMRARWCELVGEALSRRVSPAGFDGGTLRLRPDDVRWEKAAVALAPELAEKLRREVPEAGVTQVTVLPADRPAATPRRTPPRR